MIKKVQIYLDSTIIGFSVNKKDKMKYKEANLLLNQVKKKLFNAYISYLTLKEINEAPKWISELLFKKVKENNLKIIHKVSEKVLDLKKEYLKRKIIPIEFHEDAEHVAIATVKNFDALVSYNFRHIVRVETMIGVNRVNEEFNFKKLFLCQPLEVIIDEKS